MKKLQSIALTLLTFSVALSAPAEEKRFISDELSTWVRSGPGDDYRLIDSLKAGEEVALLHTNDQTKYAQIRAENGRIAWIPVAQLSNQPSLRTRVPEMEQQVKTLSDKLADIDRSWNQRTASMQKRVAGSDRVINGLKAENQQLKNELVVAEKKVNAANVQLDDKQRSLVIQWFMYGGCVAGLGLLTGLLMPHMIPRRKKADRWMN